MQHTGTHIASMIYMLIICDCVGNNVSNRVQVDDLVICKILCNFTLAEDIKCKRICFNNVSKQAVDWQMSISVLNRATGHFGLCNRSQDNTSSEFIVPSVSLYCDFVIDVIETLKTTSNIATMGKSLLYCDCVV